MKKNQTFSCLVIWLLVTWLLTERPATESISKVFSNR